MPVAMMPTSLGETTWYFFPGLVARGRATPRRHGDPDHPAAGAFSAPPRKTIFQTETVGQLNSSSQMPSLVEGHQQSRGHGFLYLSLPRTSGQRRSKRLLFGPDAMFRWTLIVIAAQIFQDRVEESSMKA